MIKKLAKYAKITIALTLIAALALPSYATVGASDGSAFVTKAEFDAALSDFNARLTTFEAGINSKIDSQVSSYLDRNGIWNGAKQTVIPQGLTVGMGIRPGQSGDENNEQQLEPWNKLRWAENTSGTWDLQRMNTSGTWINVGRGNLGGNGNTAWLRSRNNEYNIRTMPVCFESNKTGLLVATITIDGNAIEYGIRIEGTHPGGSTTSGVFYFIENGYLWATGEINEGFELLVDDTTMRTTKNVIKTIYVDKNVIKSKFNTNLVPYNINFGKADFTLIEPNRTSFLESLTYSNEDKKGLVLGGGTFVSMFFVQKGEKFWTARYNYLSSSMDDWIDLKGSTGNTQNYGKIDCVVY